MKLHRAPIHLYLLYILIMDKACNSQLHSN